MFAALLSRWTTPLPGRAHDGLFATFAPKGAAPATLRTLYHQYEDAYADEPIPPQHQHFRALVDHIASTNGHADGLGLARMRAAYVSCFERFDAFRAMLRLWRHEPEFRDALVAARRAIVADLSPREAAEMARRKHFSRWRECREAPLDIEGSRLALIRQMAADDWHEIVSHWNWDDGFAEIDWITSQRHCDRATALLALCSLAPSRFAIGAMQVHEQKLAGFVCALASRLENGFYANADFTLDLRLRQRAAFEAELAALRATGRSPWLIPDGLLDHEGARQAAPRYTISDGVIRWHYEHWLKHVAR